MSGAQPSYLKSGLATDEVVSVAPTRSEGEEFVLTDAASEASESFTWDATHEEVQTGLESLFGAGNIQAAGGPEGGALHPYVVTFTGELADQAYDFNGRRVELEGREVPELTRGRADANIVVNAANLGNAQAEGATTTLKISDTLPAGLRAVSIIGFDRATDFGRSPFRFGFNLNTFPCELKTLTCTFTEPLDPGEQLEILIGVVVEGARSTSESHEYNEVTFAGGGAPTAHLARPITVSSAPIPYGLQDYESSLEEEGGAPDTQAGSHPYQFTTALDFNQVAANFPNNKIPAAEPVQLPKSFAFKLPPGLIGNPTPFPKCTLAQFLTIINNEEDLCPTQSAVGVSLTTFDEPSQIFLNREKEPLFSLEPAVGEPARFGFILDNTPVFIDASVRTGEDYGVTAHVENVSQVVGTLNSVVTFWGVPGDPSHDSARGSRCLLHQECPGTSQNEPPALFTMPTSCNGELQFPVEGDSWAQFNERQAAHLPEQFEPLATSTSPAMVGCNRLPFDPSVKVTPDGTAASSSTGLNVDVHVPQGSILNAHGLAQSAVKDVSVAFPESLQINPSDANGLEACSEGLAGFTGFQESQLEPGVSVAGFTPFLPGDTYAKNAVGEGRLPEGEGSFQPGVNVCADATKIGEVSINTPLLPATQPLKGFVYLASQNENPFGSLVAVYLLAEDPISGAVFKAAGETQIGPTGKITGVFTNTPELAFEDAELHFFGGERAPFATPAHCGAYATAATFTPWSGNEPVPSSSTFNITSGPHGSPCPGPSLPFNPSLTGGTTNINAGSFSPLVTTIGREDGQQNLQSVQLHMPAGLEGLLSNVKLCPEVQANEGTCGPESLIGETVVSAGVGSAPVSVTGGRVYITEHYAGAPFGLSIVNPVKAGPFDLEHDTSNPANQPPCDCVVVRAKIEVNPTTAELTITTDQSGPHAIPHLIDGIPVQIKAVNVTVNREHFTFNPTNCNPMSLTGSIASDEGTSSPVSMPFQVANCANLKFTPKFEVSTSGNTSKADGASLTTRLEEPAGALGTQANIAYVKVELPKALPSRLTTLQKACTSAQFELNPAGCPAASDIGHAVVHTPLLPVPLEGPAIFVGHGGEAFPSLTMVLQGYGVTIDLVGTTFISKSGITSTAFKTVPDTPFNSFELTLPEGPYSALAANGNLCQQKLVMPTAFVAQNGATLNQNTNVKVEGCSNTLSLVSKHLTKNTLKLSVAVPSSGKLTADGVGLSKATKSANGRETITMTLKVKLTKAQAALLAHHHGRKLVDHVKLTFRLANGKKLTKTFSVAVR